MSEGLDAQALRYHKRSTRQLHQRKGGIVAQSHRPGADRQQPLSWQGRLALKRGWPARQRQRRTGRQVHRTAEETVRVSRQPQLPGLHFDRPGVGQVEAPVAVAQVVQFGRGLGQRARVDVVERRR